MKYFSKNAYFVGEMSSMGLLTIGGECELSGALSPNTSLPLTQHARLELSKDYLWLNDWPGNAIHFLYSWKCAIHEGYFSYQYGDKKIDIIEYTRGDDDYYGFPYEGYPGIFEEKKFELKLATEAEQAVIAKLNEPDCEPEYQFDDPDANRLSIPTHQFGGQPYFLGGVPEAKRCPNCSKEMELLSSIGNESYSDNDGFFGNDFVQLLYWICSDCRVISVDNIAD